LPIGYRPAGSSGEDKAFDAPDHCLMVSSLLAGRVGTAQRESSEDVAGPGTKCSECAGAFEHAERLAPMNIVVRRVTARLTSPG
jgi:hypothetical protein